MATMGDPFSELCLKLWEDSGTPYMGERYVLEVGSHSAHCCFTWSVMDSTRKPITRPDGGIETPEAVCECLYRHEAEMIVKALNALSAGAAPTVSEESK